MRIWVTRTQPDATTTAARLRALGHDPVVAPVLESRPIAGVVLPLDGVEALAFSSAHAVTAFAALSPKRDFAVFTTGAATATRARQAGFKAVVSADGDAEALADLVARAHPTRVLHPSAAEPAADLAALLGARHIPAQSIPVYETVRTRLTNPPPGIDAVLIHSARAAAIVAHLLADARMLHVEAFAISRAAAQPLAALGLARIDHAPFPNEAALLDLLK
jgi:uroporphyrinogen-III synthase